MKKLTILVILLLSYYVGVALVPVRIGLNYPTGGSFQVSIVDYSNPASPIVYSDLGTTVTANPNSSGVISFVVGEGDIDWGDQPASIINPYLVINISQNGDIIAQYRLDELVTQQAITGDGTVIPTFQNNNGVIGSDTNSIGNDFLFGSAKLNRESTVPETKFFFDHSEQAFRTGIVNTDAWNTTNLGKASFATGRDTKASGDASAAFGEGTQASSYGEVAIGSYNTTYTPDSETALDPDDRAFVIGNGTSTTPSNALVVYKNGNVNISGGITTNGIATNGYILPNTVATNAGQVLTATNTSGGTAWSDIPTPTVVTDGTTILGDGTTGNKIRLDLTNANTWTADQTVTGELQATTLSTDNYTLPTAVATATGQVLTATNTTGGTAWSDVPTPTVVTDGTTILGDGTTGNKIRLDLTNANTWTADQTFKNATVSSTGSLTMSNLAGSVSQALYVDNTGLVNASAGSTVQNAAGIYSGVFTVVTAGTSQTIANANVKANSVIIVTLQSSTIFANNRIISITAGTGFTLEFSTAIPLGDKIHYMIINN